MRFPGSSLLSKASNAAFLLGSAYVLYNTVSEGIGYVKSWAVDLARQAALDNFDDLFNEEDEDRRPQIFFTPQDIAFGLHKAGSSRVPKKDCLEVEEQKDLSTIDYSDKKITAEMIRTKSPSGSILKTSPKASNGSPDQTPSTKSVKFHKAIILSTPATASFFEGPNKENQAPGQSSEPAGITLATSTPKSLLPNSN